MAYPGGVHPDVERGLGRSLGDVLAGHPPVPERGVGPLFSSHHLVADRLPALLDVLTASFPDDLCGSCVAPPDEATVTTIKGTAPDPDQVWALTDALRAGIGGRAGVVREEEGAMGSTVVVPVGGIGSLGFLRAGSAVEARECRLVHAVIRLTSP